MSAYSESSFISSPACSSAKQSPIDLTSDAKPCNLSCDLVMDTGDATQAMVSISNVGLSLMTASNQSPSLGSCKFRGESYVCNAVIVNHPSHHKINGIQADGEVIVLFRKPTGGMLCVSSLFKVSSEQTASYNFFKQFVPYASVGSEPKIMLKDWSIAAMVPPGGYFVYEGTTVFPPCVPCEWVVFKQMINMDQGDFAYLVRNAEAGSRHIQAVGDREVFFNDTENISGVMPHDNKFYLRLRPTGKTKLGKNLETKTVDLKSNVQQSTADAQAEAANPTTYLGQFNKSYTEYSNEYGVFGGFLLLVTVACVVYGIREGLKGASTTPMTGESGKNFAVWTRQTAWWLYTSIWSFVTGIFTWLYNNTLGLFNQVKEAAAKRAAEKAALKLASTPKPTAGPAVDSKP